MYHTYLRLAHLGVRPVIRKVEKQRPYDAYSKAKYSELHERSLMISPSVEFGSELRGCKI